MTAVAPSPTPGRRSTRPLRLGVVSFVNALPLFDGLERLADIDVRLSVPSRLIEQLLADEVDLALCSSIDYQRASEPLVIAPVGLLGCSGPTLTVRVYASRPIDEIEHVYCDTDSHTSIVMMQILLKEVYGVQPALIDYHAREHVAEHRPVEWPEAMLLIGDKVVTDSPPAVRYPCQIDLGALWVEHTGRPFVFAAWMARENVDPAVLGALAAVLDRQRRFNEHRLDRIIHDRAGARRWPVDLASDYLKRRIVYEYTPGHADALDFYFGKALEHGLIEHRRPLVIADW